MIVNGFLGGLIQRVVDLHYRRLVAAPVAVVRSGKDRDERGWKGKWDHDMVILEFVSIV